MAFSITFDYRFDSSGFFDDPERRSALELAAAQWEAIILDDFDELPEGTSFEIRNPTTQATETVTLSHSVDDLIIFVGARTLPASTLAIAGPDGGNAPGDAFTARISPDFRGEGPVTEFEPWAGSISFNSSENWYFGTDSPSTGQNDFLSVAVHELGHVLGVGTSGAFDSWIVDHWFTGPNAIAVNDGRPVPIDHDLSHVEDGFAGDSVALDPTLVTGTRVLISDYDAAILADIGYEIDGFTKQGVTPPLATNGSERVFGREVADNIDGLAGNDTLQGDSGDDTLLGNTGDDDLFGQSGHDTLIGGDGDDYLDGGSGNDELRGGAGADRYFGQDGIDVFVIGPGDGLNTISDFDLTSETLMLVDSGFRSEADAASAVTKPFSNVSRVTLFDGTSVDVFHSPQSGSPLTAAHFKLVQSDTVSKDAETPADEESAPPVLVDPVSEQGEPNNPPELIGGNRTGGLLQGTAGNDGNLVATAALERIDGLGGVDTAVFAGDQSDFTVTFGPSGVSVTDRTEGGLGTIALDNVELIDFGTDLPQFGGPMDLRLFGGQTGLDEAAFESFVEMYIAYFNRAPDAIGLSFWATAYAKGMSLEQIANEFATQPETLATYPADTSNIRFAADVYENVLGRSPDIDGLRFWTNALDDGAVTRGEFILEVLRGVKAPAPADASQAFIDRQLADQLYLEQKTDLGALFAVHRGMSNVDDAAQVLALFDGSAASLDTAVEAIETLYTAATDPINGDFLMPLVGVLDNPFAV